MTRGQKAHTEHSDRDSQRQKQAPMAKIASDSRRSGGGVASRMPMEGRVAKIMADHIQDQIDVEVCRSAAQVLAFGALYGWQLNCKIIIFNTNLTTTTTTTIAVEDSPSATWSVASNEMEINWM